MAFSSCSWMLACCLPSGSGNLWGTWDNSEKSWLRFSCFGVINFSASLISVLLSILIARIAKPFAGFISSSTFWPWSSGTGLLALNSLFPTLRRTWCRPIRAAVWACSALDKGMLFACTIAMMFFWPLGVIWLSNWSSWGRRVPCEAFRSFVTLACLRLPFTCILGGSIFILISACSNPCFRPPRVVHFKPFATCEARADVRIPSFPCSWLLSFRQGRHNCPLVLFCCYIQAQA